mgnify:CR=1 FL=1
MDASADRKSNEINVTMEEPIRILMLFTIMNRGGAETMVMNYYRHIDRNRVQFDFMVHRQERGAYDDEIEAMGGKIYRMIPLHPFTFNTYRKQISDFFDQHPEYRIIHGHCSESGYFVYREAAGRRVPVIIAHAHNAHALFDTKWLFRTYFKHTMRPYLTQGFTCGKEAARWLFGNELGKKAILQRNAIDTFLYRFDEAVRLEVRQELHLSKDVTVVGHVGRFNRQKNHEFLLEVFHKYVQELIPQHTCCWLVRGNCKKPFKKGTTVPFDRPSTFVGGTSGCKPPVASDGSVFCSPLLWKAFPFLWLRRNVPACPALCPIAFPAKRL